MPAKKVAKPTGRPKAPGRVMRIRLSETVDARLKSQAEALGMSPTVYATFLVAQTTLGQANAMTAMESAVKTAMQSQLDAMEPTGGEGD